MAQFKPEEAEKAAQAAKQRKLALAESYKQARKQKDDTKGSNDDGFVSRMLNSILSTLQLTVTKLHFRYEDAGISSTETYSDFHCPSFAAGLCLSSLTGLSTDSGWNESSTSGSVAEMLLYKLLSVKANSIYVDSRDGSVFDSSMVESKQKSSIGADGGAAKKEFSQAKFNELMVRTMEERCDGGAHAYVLEPVEATFKVTLNRNRANFEYPQLQVESVFQAVSIGMRPFQLQSALFMSKRLEYFNTSSKYLQWRPSETPSQNPKAWWKFAIDCVLREVRERHKPWLPESIDLRRKRREAYVPLYSRTINAKAKSLNSGEQAELAELERVLAFDDILYFRALAEVKLQKDESTRAASAVPQQSWGNWISSFVWTPAAGSAPTNPTNQATSSSTTSTPAITPESTPTKAAIATTPKTPKSSDFWESVQLSEEETSQLLDAINFERASSSSLSADTNASKSRLTPPDNYIKFRFCWNQKAGELTLSQDSGLALSSFAFYDLKSNAIVREKQLALDVTLMSVVATDSSSKDTHFPKILYPQHDTTTTPLLKLLVINNKRDTKATTKTSTISDPSASTTTSSPSKHASNQKNSSANADWNIDFSLKKLNVVFNAAMVTKHIDCFKEPFRAPDDFIWSDTITTPEKKEEKANTKSEENSWTSWTRTKRRNEQLLALATLKPSTKVKIKIEAPNILVPKNCAAFDSPIVVLELGTFTMASKLGEVQDPTVDADNHPSNQLQTTSTTTDTHLRAPSLHITANSPSKLDGKTNSSSHALQQKDIDVTNFYDQFDFSISNIQAVVSRTERVGAMYGLSSTPGTHKPPSKYSRIINPFGFNFSLAICKINVETLPNVKLAAALPSLRIVLSSSKIETVKSLVSSFVKQFAPPKRSNQSNVAATALSALSEDNGGLGSVTRTQSAPTKGATASKPLPSNQASSSTSFGSPNRSKGANMLRHSSSTLTAAPSRVEQLVGDIAYTQSLAAAADVPEEEMVAVGLGLSIEVDIPEIEVTLVQCKDKKTRTRTSSSGSSPSLVPTSVEKGEEDDDEVAEDAKSEKSEKSSNSSDSDDSYASARSFDNQLDVESIPSSATPVTSTVDEEATISEKFQKKRSSSTASSDRTTPLPKENSKERRELICLRLANLGYRMEAHSTSIQVRTFLNSLSVEDFSQPANGPFKYLITSHIPKEEISSPENNTKDDKDDLLDLGEVLASTTVVDDSLIQVTYTYKFPHASSPGDIHNHCKLRFNELQVNLSIATIGAVYRYIYFLAKNPVLDSSPSESVSMLPSQESTRPKNATENPIQHSASEPAILTSKIDPPVEEIKKKEESKKISFLLEMECEAIVINFVEQNTLPLAEVSLRGSTGSFQIIEGQGWLLQAKLGNPKVLDTYTPANFFDSECVHSSEPSTPPSGSPSRKHVISVKGPHLIEFSLTNIRKETSIVDETPIGLANPTFITLDVTINSIRVLIIPKWVFTMILNVGEIIAVFTMPAAGENNDSKINLTSSEVIAPSVDYLAAPAFFSYRVTILRPFIIFPKDGKSTSVLITDWGEIDVSHSIVEQPLPNVPGTFLPPQRRFREKIVVSLKKANIATGQLSTSATKEFSPFSNFQNTRPIVGESDISVSISSSLVAHTTLPRQGMLLEVHIGSLNLFLSPEQVKFLIVVLQNSLFYQPTEEEIRRRLLAALAAEAAALLEDDTEIENAPKSTSSDHSDFEPHKKESSAPILSETSTTRIQIERISVEAHDSYELFPSDAEASSKAPSQAPKLLLLELNKSKIAWTTFSDGSLRLGFQIASASIFDLRNPSLRTNNTLTAGSEFLQPVSPRYQAGTSNTYAMPVLLGADIGKSQIVGSCVTVPTKGQFNISLTFTNLQFLPEASILQTTWANLGPLLLKDLMGLLAHRERIMLSSLTPRQELIWKSQKYHPEAGATYSFTLNRPQIVLIHEEPHFSGNGKWTKFSNITASSCEIDMKITQAHQSYELDLKELSTSLGETFNASLAELFRPSALQSKIESSNNAQFALNHSLYHYNVLSPCSMKIALILLPTVHDFQIDFADIAKISFSYNDYKNFLAMCTPFTVSHLKPSSFDALDSPSEPASSGAATSNTSNAQSRQHHNQRMNIKEKPKCPSISDQMDYHMVRTDSGINATAVSVSAATRDPKRATEYWSNLDEEKKKMGTEAPELTLGTASASNASYLSTRNSPRISQDGNSSSQFEESGGYGAEEDGRPSLDSLASVSSSNAASVVSNETDTIVEFVHKKLMVFNPKIQIMLMDNREYDLGIIRAEMSAQECWLQDWGARAYIDALPSNHLETLKATAQEIGQDILPKMKLSVQATLSADAFNFKAAAWEPLLDPFDVIIGLSDRSLLIKAQKTINLTISETFLSSYKRFSSVIDSSENNNPNLHHATPTSTPSSTPRDPGFAQISEREGTNRSSASQSSHAGTYHPQDSSSSTLNTTSQAQSTTPGRQRIQAAYYVKNETGLPIRYQLFPEDNALDPTQERTLVAGGEEPINIPSAWAAHYRNLEILQANARGGTTSNLNTSSPLSATSRQPHQQHTSAFRHLDRSVQSIANRHFTISAHVQSLQKAMDLSVDQIGTQVAHIGPGRLLIIEIQYRLGAKLITFKSRFGIHNNTAHPLVVGREYYPQVASNANAASGTRDSTLPTPTMRTSSSSRTLSELSAPSSADYVPSRASFDVSRINTGNRGDYTPSRTSLDGGGAGRQNLTQQNQPRRHGEAPLIAKIATIEPFAVWAIPLDCTNDTVLRFKPGSKETKSGQNSSSNSTNTSNDPSSHRTPSSTDSSSSSLSQQTNSSGSQGAQQNIGTSFNPSSGASSSSSETNQSTPDSLKFGWSQMRCEVRNLKPMSPMFVDCTTRPKKSGSNAGHQTAPDLAGIFQYSVGVSRLANKSAILAGAEQLVIYFQPPIIIENLLPAAMTFSIEPQHTKKSKNSSFATYLPKVGNLKKGQRLPVHQVPTECYITLRMRVRGFEWTKHVLLRKPERSGAQIMQGIDASESSGLALNTDVFLQDPMGKKLRIRIDNQVNELGTRIIAFFADFWIVNKTGLPLLARAHISDPSALGAGMMGLYQTPTSSSSSSSSSSSGSNTTSYDMVDDRNGSGVYGGDLRDFFLPDLSAGCYSAGISSSYYATSNSSDSSSSGANNGQDSQQKIHSQQNSSQSHAGPSNQSQSNSQTSGNNSSSSKQKIPNTAKPMMYCPYGFENKRFHLKVAESRWSDSLVLNTQNDSTVLSVLETEDATRPKRKYELAITIRPAANQFWRTRVITVSPRYMMINKTPYTLFVRQVSSSIVSTLLPGEHAPLHWLDAGRGSDLFRIKWNLPKCTWSGPIDPSILEMFTLKLFNAETGLRYLIRINVRMHPESSISTITFKEEDVNAPLFRIDNYTLATLLLRQLNIEYATESIPPLTRRIWGWLQPAYNSHRVQVLFNTIDKVGLSFSLAKVKAYPPIKFQTREGRTVWVLAETSTERTTRVLSLRPIPDPTIRTYAPRTRPPLGSKSTASTSSSKLSKKSSAQASSNTAGGAGRNSSNTTSISSSSYSSQSANRTSESAKTGSNASVNAADTTIDTEEDHLEETLALQISFNQLSVSLINAEPLELIYGTLSRISVSYVNYSVRWSLDLSIGDVQIDNQIPATFYPVAVYSLGDAPEHWLRFSMIRSYEYADIIYQPFVCLLLRATTIRVDELLLLKLLDLTGVTLASFVNTGETSLTTSNVDVMALGEDEDASKMIYNHLYLLNPVALTISFLSSSSSSRARETQMQLYDQDSSFSMFSSSSSSSNSSGAGNAEIGYSGEGSSGNRTYQRKQANAILGISDRFIPNVDSAPLNLNALLLKHSFVSSDQLRNRILQHYKAQVMRQLYAILGSFEALGNPISLVSNLGTGFKDLFYEPAKGIAISPEEFGAGLKRGGASFVTKSVAGLFNSTSKVLRTIGSGVAFVSMDEEYRARRDLAKRRDQPTNALTGVFTGMKEFGEGLAEGVAGIIVQPVRGFQQEGALGIAKGMGKGIIGAAVKPVVGTLDLVQRLTEGVSNTAAPTVLMRRLRYPRFIAEDGLLRSYDAQNSTAMNILHSIENSAFAHEAYWGYIMVSKSRENNSSSLIGWVLIASSTRILLASRLRPSNATSSSSSTSNTSSAASSSPMNVNVQWVAPYRTITAVEKVIGADGGLNVKISTRNRDNTLISHQIKASDVNHCVELQAFVENSIKKWETLSKFASLRFSTNQ